MSPTVGASLSLGSLLVPGLLALSITVAVMPLVLRLVGRRVLDHPNLRSSHAVATPRGGGIGPAAACLAVLAVTGGWSTDARLSLAVAAAGFGLIGLTDDLHPLPVSTRLAAQGLVAVLSLPWLLDGLHGANAWQVLFACGTAVWLVAYVNAFNFMDGINGISAAQALVAGGAWCALGAWHQVPVVARGGVIVAGAAAAFAPFNFPRARIFLGDAGSYFLGAWLAVLAVFALRAGLTPEAVLAPLTLTLADTATTLVRRVRSGARWSEAHRDHAYQRLCAAGWPHARTTVFVLATLVVVTGLGVLAGTAPTTIRVLIDLGALATVLGYLAAPAWATRPRPSALVA